MPQFKYAKESKYNNAVKPLDYSRFFCKLVPKLTPLFQNEPYTFMMADGIMELRNFNISNQNQNGKEPEIRANFLYQLLTVT